MAGPKARVCLNCNTRWMSVLEGDTKPLLIDMWDNKRLLDVHDQQILAAWATKMAVLLDGLADTPVIPRGFAHDLRVSRTPPGGVWVWASLFVGPTQYASAWLRPLWLVPRGGLRPEDPNGVCVTFTAFRVVFQVVITFYRGQYDLTLTRDVGQLLTALWPSDGAAHPWPAGGFDADAVADLEERIADSASDNAA